MANDIHVRIRQIGDSTSEAAIRTHTVRIDRPVPKGGDDQGPMGGELFLAAIGGCFMSNLLAAIKAREANAANARVEVVGTLEESPARFTLVELRVTADCPDAALFERLVEIAERGCIMVNTLKGKLDLRVRIGATV